MLYADDDLCLMPKPLADGTFAAGRIDPGQLTEWIRFILEKLEVPRSELSNVGSHSCKATLLSMAAKAGMGEGSPPYPRSPCDPWRQVCGRWFPG